MRKFFTLLLFGLSMLAWPAMAQEIDESYVFMDEEGNIIENGATVVRNVVESFDEVSDVIYSGISVLNLGGSTTDHIKMNYVINRIDNGTYQICFPTTCNMQTEVGVYETGIGQLMGDLQDIQSEWFPVADGECVVTLTIEIFTKMGFFPPTYIHKADGPTIMLRFVKGNVIEPIVGDVNGDGEVNIADVNAVINMILDSPAENGDVNGDGEVNIADVNAIIDIILNS
ncbi:MAG: dockerin type I repeat-containing protein [Muribaculaceae bacterium]|nr:dockerin type I repeat-containing protein [Muribaculaceae bacterium]